MSWASWEWQRESGRGLSFLFGVSMRDLTNDPMVYKPLLPHLIPPLFDQIELVGLHIVEHLPQAARPLDLDGLGVRRLAKAEMQTEIAQIGRASCRERV